MEIVILLHYWKGVIADIIITDACLPCVENRVEDIFGCSKNTVFESIKTKIFYQIKLCVHFGKHIFWNISLFYFIFFNFGQGGLVEA